ncbi:MAG: protein-L-isoaspartate(D-aspartate) O-methyltransferase [Anaerolineales bacterium]|nr:MAG: protein-L-isoaspartate(D-aspartate) O-methyltransferase [Anaerolineales bacterium]
MDFQAARQRMVEQQIANRGITSPRILEAFREVPRHMFVPDNQQIYAYQDGPLPIGLGQTISQPYIVAYMTDFLRLQGDEKVLEIGTGSGYQAAILGLLAREIHTIERHPALADYATRLLGELGYKNIQVHKGDGTRGLPGYAPYQAIMVTAAGPEVPAPVLDQLAEGGRLIMPVGPKGSQVLCLYHREGDSVHREDLVPVAFVPLVGEYGWDEK